MNFNRPFSPKFLKKFDYKLLLAQPETWSTRTHWVWYYGWMFCFLLGSICFIYPNDARGNSGVLYWIFFVSIISILSLIFWLKYLLRFNVFKRFGNISGINRLKVFGLYFASVAMIIFFTYIPPIIETIKANLTYKDEEVITDINNFNKLVNQLEYDSTSHIWEKDTIKVIQESIGNIDKQTENTYRCRIVDSAEFKARLAGGDTIIQLFKNVYEIYSCPSYIKLNIYNTDDSKAKIKILDKILLYNTIIKNFKKTNETQARIDIDGLIKKYYFAQTEKYDYASYEDISDTSYSTRLKKRYQIRMLERSLKNICDKKFRFSTSNLDWECRIIFYISLIITLLLFAFRHSTTKTFFLSILTSVILSILTGLITAFFKGTELSFFELLIFYIIAFAVISLFVFKNKIRNAVVGISINLFVIFITFLPIIILALYDSNLKRQSYVTNNNLNKKVYESLSNYYPFTEILGVIILIILLPTLIHNLYKKWYALPQE